MSNWWRHSKNLILFDSSFWIGFIEAESDDYEMFLNEYQDKTFLIPYPSLAEFLNDRLLRNPVGFNKIKKFFINRQNIKFYKHNLSEYEKDKILDDFLTSSMKLTRSGVPNFVDIIIGKIIEEMNAPFIFVTKNSGDFFKFINKNRSMCNVLDFEKKTML